MGKYRQALERLSDWFDRQKRVLPWREDPGIYRVWVSEIMLQQTQVITVVPYFERFIERFPTVNALAQALLDEVLQSWAGLGYYSRARNLHRAAQVIVVRGSFPEDRESWLEIPGVGNYTAGAILSIALNKPEAILDGNVERVLSRVRRVSRAAGDSAFKDRLWRLSRVFVRDAHRLGIAPRVLNQALMELGATVCSPRQPTCLLCPLREICRAAQAGEQELYPPRKKPKAWVKVREEVHCLIDFEGRVLLRQRSRGEWREGLWDFPEAAPPGDATRIGQVETQFVVTRHKVTRLTHVWKTRALVAAEGASEALRWVSGPSEVAAGSALKKTLRRIRETFPEAWPRS